MATGATSVVVTCVALLVACSSLAIQFAAYYCFYKPKLRSLANTTTAAGCNSQRDCNQRESEQTGSTSSDSVMYDIIDGSVDEEIAVEMEENEAYDVKKRQVEGLRMELNEAYDATRSGLA